MNPHIFNCRPGEWEGGLELNELGWIAIVAWDIKSPGVLHVWRVDDVIGLDDDRGIF